MLHLTKMMFLYKDTVGRCCMPRDVVCLPAPVQDGNMCVYIQFCALTFCSADFCYVGKQRDENCPRNQSLIFTPQIN